MNGKKAHIARLILCVFLAIIAEKAIPHTHIERNGLLVPNWDNTNPTQPYESDAEQLHSSFYLAMDHQFTFADIHLFFVPFELGEEKAFVPLVCCNNYNILPKVLNSILFCIHTYSSKAPPLYS